jgi:exonuclease VII small subunit
VLRAQYSNERDLRINAEADLARVRQQLADLLQTSHRDISNLKKALSDMQTLNNRSLATIYEKGDQNLQQMQQMEDLSAIIRARENTIADLNQSIQDLQDDNRNLHQ